MLICLAGIRSYSPAAAAAAVYIYILNIYAYRFTVPERVRLVSFFDDFSFFFFFSLFYNLLWRAYIDTFAAAAAAL